MKNLSLLVTLVTLLVIVTQTATSGLVNTKKCTYYKHGKRTIERCFSNTIVAIPSGASNYWNFNNNYIDSVTQTSLINGFNVSFVTDRFGRANSALYLKYGYISIPNTGSVWFNGELTIGLWDYIVTYGATSNAKAFDCGYSIDQINFSSNWQNQYNFYFEQYDPSYNGIHSPVQGIALNTWTHKTMVVKLASGTSYNAYAYINGVLLTSQTNWNKMILNNLGTCYFGKSLWGYIDYNLNGYLDDIVFYRRGLSASEVFTLYKYTS